jgi:hypothetical protein
VISLPAMGDPFSGDVSGDDRSDVLLNKFIVGLIEGIIGNTRNIII